MFSTNILRRLSGLVLLTFTSLTLQPLQAAAQNQIERAKPAQPRATQTAPQRDDAQYSKLLDDMKETAKRGADHADKHLSTRDDAKTLRQQKTQLAALEAKVDQDLAATEADLIAKKLPPEILTRHRAAVADYKAKQSEFKRQLKTLEDADDKEDETGRATGIGSLATWLDQNQKGKPHTKTDPNKLPFRTPDAKVRSPVETEQGYRAKPGLFEARATQQAGALPKGANRFAAITDPRAPSTADDLAETEEVRITPAIQAQAAALNNNPVKIHNWVRNNIEFIPSYGSIQGSEMTFQAKRGNAFDTASLEIALLRAAGIPARYVYGTIQRTPGSELRGQVLQNNTPQRTPGSGLAK
ncbi:MAG: transglutaminase domain-containing protein [Sulfuricellaceae bacterium]